MAGYVATWKRNVTWEAYETGFKGTLAELKLRGIISLITVDGKLTTELFRLAERLNIDPCGEGGEFHTFVYDGPLFSKPIKMINSTPVLRDDRWFLDILEYSLG